jgi:GT2 family glycosyltransferase
MSEKQWGVVIPATQNRVENLKEVAEYLNKQTVLPDEVVIVCDGWDSYFDFQELFNVSCKSIRVKKYIPDGFHDQPRNIGVKYLSKDIDYVWFLDSDCIPSSNVLEAYKNALEKSKIDRILIGPYEWLPPGKRHIDPTLHNDPRTQIFRDFGPEYIAVRELNFALACFSGNLVWPVKEFKRVGGFWNEIHAGRCEDGELGLRASSMGVPMSVVPDARAWHLYHEINMNWIQSANSRDVPKLNARHPWVQEKGIIVADKDGKRFDIICPRCNEQINTNEIWGHPCQIR